MPPCFWVLGAFPDRDGSGGGRSGVLAQHLFRYRGLALLLHLLFHGRDVAPQGVGGVVEVDQHGRAFGVGFEEVAELAPEVGADDIAVVGDFGDAADFLFDVDVEVVVPEIGEDFLELPLRFNGPDELGLFNLADGCDRAIGAGFSDFLGHGHFGRRVLFRAPGGQLESASWGSICSSPPPGFTSDCMAAG